ncbi:MAG: hypothetical protein IKH57_08170 [Clostridia bacterium]|nr:hypothetical protein [Clostridia bacterium]MBR6028410.1 hypothetical protein [Clostridia bacterium]
MTDLDLALRHAPIIHYDAADTIPLRAVGWTVFHETAPSRSFPGRKVEVGPGAAFTVEYACYFDYDIGHMYDLEHVWVTIDREGRPMAAEGSFHGKYLSILVPGWPGSLPPENGRVHAFCQPGKHAFLAAGNITRLFPHWDTCCSHPEGGVLLGNPFCAAHTPTGKDAFTPTEEDHRNASRWLREKLAFEPTLDFSRAEIPDASLFMTWDELYERVPGWIEEECGRIRGAFGSEK